MKCKVCGAEGGKYPLCRECNRKKEAGEIIKCPKCNSWHYKDVECTVTLMNNSEEQEIKQEQFLYQLKSSLITKAEQQYLTVIKEKLPSECILHTQANLASFIMRTDNSRFQNELYRNVDFLVTDLNYKPLFVIEINDKTHLTPERRERDDKVTRICEEAGIPIIKLWTSYGINPDYIEKRIKETLESLPIKRIPHFIKEIQKKTEEQTISEKSSVTKEKKGCYIATCVYGSYDCPQVWVLRRFRDYYLEESLFGRLFIRIYYTFSPIAVKWFGNTKLFYLIFKKYLDNLVRKLEQTGIESTPYQD